jgi:hypothetical protein
MQRVRVNYSIPDDPYTTILDIADEQNPETKCVTQCLGYTKREHASYTRVEQVCNKCHSTETVLRAMARCIPENRTHVSLIMRLTTDDDMLIVFRALADLPQHIEELMLFVYGQHKQLELPPMAFGLSLPRALEIVTNRIVPLALPHTCADSLMFSSEQHIITRPFHIHRNVSRLSISDMCYGRITALAWIGKNMRGAAPVCIDFVRLVDSVDEEDESFYRNMIFVAFPNAFVVRIGKSIYTDAKRYAYQEAWILASTLMAWRRANKRHPLHDSGLQMALMILSFTERPAHWAATKQPFPPLLRLSAFLGSRFMLSQIE